jgi:hypothetical protein
LHFESKRHFFPLNIFGENRLKISFIMLTLTPGDQRAVRQRRRGPGHGPRARPQRLSFRRPRPPLDRPSPLDHRVSILRISISQEKSFFNKIF